MRGFGVIVALLLAGGAASPSPRLSAPSTARTPGDKPAPFHSEVVARIPVGPKPDQISDAECLECDEGCSAGLAFMDDTGALYIYDYGHENIKVLHGIGTDTLHVELLPGVHVTYTMDRPVDGAVAGDHTIYLLSDRGSPTDRYQLHLLRPGDRSWDSGPHFDVPSVGRNSLRGRNLPVMNAARLARVDDGGVALYDLDLRRNGGVLVARTDGPLAPSAFVPRSPGLRLASGFAITRVGRSTRVQSSGQPAKEFQLRGEFLGADARGDLYLAVPHPGPPFYWEKYSPDGRLLAQTIMPRRSAWKGLAGKGDCLITKDGTILELTVTRIECVVTRWSVGHE